MTVDNLQCIVDEIRTSIFNLQTPAGQGGFRQRIQAAVADLTDDRHIATTLRMSGPMAAISAVLAEHAEAVISEAISNAIRHSGASTITVVIDVTDDLSVDVIDNGCGIPVDNQRHSGLANMRWRAEEVGGACTISAPATGGTRVLWTAPLIDE